MTDDEKRELIAEVRDEFLPHSNDVWACDLTARLADALEGTPTEPEWEYCIVGHGYVTVDRYELDAPLTALRRRRRTERWEVVPDGDVDG